LPNGLIHARIQEEISAFSSFLILLGGNDERRSIIPIVPCKIDHAATPGEASVCLINPRSWFSSLGWHALAGRSTSPGTHIFPTLFFPGGELSPINVSLQTAVEAGFEV
jgi:hypothetical protein